MVRDDAVAEVMDDDDDDDLQFLPMTIERVPSFAPGLSHSLEFLSRVLLPICCYLTLARGEFLRQAVVTIYNLLTLDGQRGSLWTNREGNASRDKGPLLKENPVNSELGVAVQVRTMMLLTYCS